MRLEPQERRLPYDFPRVLTLHSLIGSRPARTTRPFGRTEIWCLARSGLAPIDAPEISAWQLLGDTQFRSA